MTYYLMLDPVQSDPQSLTTAAIKQQQQQDANKIATIDNPAIPAIVAKQLRVQPCAPGSALWEESHEWTSPLDNNRHCVSGWLEAELSTQSLAFALKANMVQPTPNGGKALIRMYDPRVLQHLHVLLTQEQLAALISPVERWTYSDWNGELRTIEIERPRRQVNFTEAQWASIERFEATWHVIQVWKEFIAYKGIEYKIPSDASLKIDSLVMSALDNGLVSQRDVTAYALCRIMYQDDFDKTPEAHALLEKNSKSIGFSDSFSFI